MIVQVATARRLSYRAAQLLASGGGQMEASLAKLYASRMAEQVTRDAVQLHGGMGYGEESDVSRYFADARVCSASSKALRRCSHCASSPGVF